MSPREATALAHPARPLGAARPQPGRAPGRPRLNLVPPLRTGAPRAPFVVLLGTLLIGGLAGLLFLHTALAEDSFRLHDLKTRSALLTDREQALEQQVALEASPKRLAAQAEGLGMVHSVNPVFIRLSDGRVLGKPKPGVAPPPPAPTASSRRHQHRQRLADTDLVGHAPRHRPPGRLGDGHHLAPPAPAALDRSPPAGPTWAAAAAPGPAARSVAGAPAGGRGPSPTAAAAPPTRAAARRLGAAAARRCRGAGLRAVAVRCPAGPAAGPGRADLRRRGGAGPAAHRDAARGPRHDHRPQRGGAGHHGGSGQHHLRPDQGRRPGRHGRRAGPGAQDGPRGAAGEADR